MTWSYTGHPDITATVRYEHANTDESVARRVLFLVWNQPFSNAALTYNVAATYPVTSTWNHPTTYARYPINAGNGHDDFGLFDPHRYNTEQVHERNRVLLVLQKYLPGDTSTNPEMGVKVIVDGEAEGESSKNYVIRLGRPASDFAFNDISLGNNTSGIAHIQCYDYDPGDNDELVPSMSEMQTMYAAADRWLGAFTNADSRTDIFKFGADIEVAADDGVILSGTKNGNRYKIEIDDTTPSSPTISLTQIV